MTRSTVLRANGILWLFTLSVALVVFALPAAHEAARDYLDLSFQSNVAGFSGFTHIWLRNWSICMLVPILIVVFEPWRSTARGIAATALLALPLVPSIAYVGMALGAYGDQVLPFLVHLPVEWAAVGFALALWPTALQREIPRRDLVRLAIGLAALTMTGALVESFVSA